MQRDGTCPARKRPMTADYDAAIRDNQVWVLENDDQILAALVLVAAPVSFLLENIAIAEDIQSTGVGGWMLAFAVSWAARQGYAEIVLYTNEKMGDNTGYYARRGYSETHREPFGDTMVIHMKKQVA